MKSYDNVVPLSQCSFSGKLPRKTGRHGHRDATLILISYRHALRVSELIVLRWDQVDLGQGLMHINRLKNGVDATHPVRGP